MENLHRLSPEVNGAAADELQRLAAMINQLPAMEPLVDGRQSARPNKLSEPAGEPAGEFAISDQDILSDLLLHNQDNPEVVERLRRDFAAGKIKL